MRRMSRCEIDSCVAGLGTGRNRVGETTWVVTSDWAGRSVLSSIYAAKYVRALIEADGARLYRVALPLGRQHHDGLRYAVPSFWSLLVWRKRDPGLIQRGAHQAERLRIECSVPGHGAS